MVRLTLFSFLVFIACSASAGAEPIEPANVRVLDGNTIHVYGEKSDVRLTGYNAPERRGARCRAERDLATRATRRLIGIVFSGNLDFAYVPCACKPGTEGTRACNLRRKCGVLKSGGRDVGEILMTEKLAVPFQCEATSCPPTPRPWCEPKG